ncbi:hypothetical protein G6F46_003489 [Rhizopus delemar]|uniref:Uncharacterized protein n=2 Tax=Rhizopus TaxID=4842 RepID=A0A9P6Z1H6_9FUNG|nr:hypothetical protein G6F36_012987 [Rhizopus arrhizus]KAG1457422.1 hypothetical protein G6F55_005939 [Rhizopus delemar]KAG1496230.1 hypothetical protein G6F54_006622 [Rhizopus delemar]KAG1510740.1 hypothetical protein G6F52_010824 [Rhizopus delemar]KAG1515109.1 hypothetical protein G6F53_003163 [Rhizopus delemar]
MDILALLTSLATRLYTQIVCAQLEYRLAINEVTSFLVKELEDAQNICLHRIFGGSSRSFVKMMLRLTKLPTIQEYTCIHSLFGCPRRNSTVNTSKKNRKPYQTKQLLTVRFIDQSNIISDFDKDPNDSDYKHKGMKELSASSDKEEEEFIDPEELLQLQQGLKVPAFDLTNDTQKHQHNKQYENIMAL